MRLKAKRVFTRKSVVASLAVLMLSMLLAGCSDDDNNNTPRDVPDPPTANRTATISGRVVDSSSGAGRVATLEAVEVRTTSDADGTFTLDNVPRSQANTPIIITLTDMPGGYPATAAAVVAVAGGLPGRNAGNVLVAGVEIELHDQAGTIAGQVLKVTGEPVEGINVTLDAVQIPVITPGTVNPNPSSGVHPFELTAANSRAITGADGRFTISGVPEDWIYNIIIIPPIGTSNLTFANQFLPSGSHLNFPDAVGAPPDSGAWAALNLAGLADLENRLNPRLNGEDCFEGDGECTTGEVPQLGASLVAAGPVVLNPALVGNSDTIPPFVLASGQVVDGLIIIAADNTAGRTLSFTVSERLLQNDGELAAFLRLEYVGRGVTFVEGKVNTALTTKIPYRVTVDPAGTTVTIAPQVFNDAGRPIPLPAGVYSITGLSALRDRVGNKYTGFAPNDRFDAAGAVELPRYPDHDQELDFVVLGDTSIPGAPPVASIMCTNCNNSKHDFTVTFDAVTDAVQYIGLFATEGDNVFTTLSETIRLANPPEFLDFDLTGPVDLNGFQFPLVAGTEMNAVPVLNNFFDDGIRYQVGIQVENRQGVRGPQATALIDDVISPAFDRGNMADSSCAPGQGNDINDALKDPACPVGSANLTTMYTLLENVFSTSSAGDMTRESIRIAEDTIGFNFFDEVVDANMMDGADNVYSAADVAAVLPIEGRVTVRFNEHIDAMVTLMDPVLSSPALPGFAADGTPLDMAAVNPDANDGMVSIAFVTDGDMINDEDLLGVTFDDALAPDTGDSLDFSASGITDEAANALAAGTVLLIANHIPAFITEAVATAGTAENDVLALTFSRPIIIDDVVDDMGNLVTTLDLTDGVIFGGMAALSADGLTLTITTMDDGDLAALTRSTTINGAGLQTNDALSFLGGLPVNRFAGGTAAIVVVDEVPPTLRNVIDGGFGGNTINTDPPDNLDALLQVGDFTETTYRIHFVFDQAVWELSMGMVSFPSGVDPEVTTMSDANFDIRFVNGGTTLVDMDTLIYDFNLNPVMGDVGVVAMGDTITISAVTDLSLNSTVNSTATLNDVDMGITIGGVVINP